MFFGLRRSCVTDVGDEKIVNLRPCSAFTDTDVQGLSKIAFVILKCQGDLDCVGGLLTVDCFVL